MRDILDKILLLEVTMSKYGPGKKFLVSGSVDGKQLALALQSKGIDTEGPIELTALASSGQYLTVRPSAPIIPTGKGNDQYEFKDQNQNFFYLTGTSSSVSKGFVHFKDKETDLSNKGEVSEGLLGAAMFAKFTHREPGEDIGIVSEHEVWAVLEKLKQTGKELYQVTVNDSDSVISDTITFSLKLKTGPYKDLMNPLKRPAMAPLVASAVAYVNNPRAESYSKYFYLNGKADEISILADGAASETEKKADVWVAIKDKNGQMRALKLNTSLKVGGVKQFGQVGGSGADSLNKLFGYFDIDFGPYMDKFKKLHAKDEMNAMDWIYNIMADLFKKKLAGNDNSVEYHFIDSLAHAITNFATLGDPNVELVDFDKGGYKILRFRNLNEKLKDVDLTASVLGGKARPEISIYDKNNSKRNLINIRMKIETRKDGSLYLRNIIEKGPLLEELTKFEYRSFDELPKKPIAKPNTVSGQRVDIRPPGTPEPRAKRTTDTVRKRR